nr:hypothetical protein CFP56_62169 [Quercus suber]
MFDFGYGQARDSVDFDRVRPVDEESFDPPYLRVLSLRVEQGILRHHWKIHGLCRYVVDHCAQAVSDIVIDSIPASEFSDDSPSHGIWVAAENSQIPMA